MITSTRSWLQTLLPIGSSIRQAIQVLDESALKIVLVTNDTGVLVGTISDGDIRRGLLKGLDLGSSIDSIVHYDAIIVPSGLSNEVILKLMIANEIQQIPIVDENFQVVGLHLWDQISSPSARANIMIIMAGGKGTRLHPQTENCPKSLLPVAGKPILEHIIDRAKGEGISNFVLAIHHLGHMIEEYFGNGQKFGVNIEYLREQFPMGTAGALSLINPTPENAFIVTNGDVLTDVRYGGILDFHIQHNASATMGVRVYELQNPFGVVQTQGIDIVGYEEKPLHRTHINAGVYVLEPSAIALLGDSVLTDMPTLFTMIKGKSKKVIAYPIHERWLDVGRPSDLQTANSENFREIEITNE